MICFERDKDAWREVVKLWCGLANQSTELIRALYALEPITAFECLADANNVAPDLSDEIIEYFKGQLDDITNQDAISSAFGAVASSNRQGSRGESILTYLQDTLLNAQHYSPSLPSVAAALAKTNLPEAAAILAQHYQEISDQSHPLAISLRSQAFANQLYSEWLPELFVRMGDLAVPELVKIIKKDSRIASYRLMLYRLKEIRTPNSALALVDFLWDTDEVLAIEAAWQLAEILPQPEIEEALREYSLTERQKKADYLDWIWSPFKEPVNSALPIIMGRVAYLINRSPDDKISFHLNQVTLDPRLIIPLCAIENFGSEALSLQWDQTAESLLEQRENSAELYQRISKKVNEILKDVDSRWRLFLLYLTPRLQLDLIHRLVNDRRPVQRDWVNLFTRLKYEFQISWHYRVVLIISFLISLTAIIQISLLITENPKNTESLILSFLIYIIIFFWSLLFKSAKKSLKINIFMDFGLSGLATFTKELWQLHKNNLVWIGIPSLINSPVKAMVNTWTWIGVAVIAGAWAWIGPVVASWSWIGAVFIAEAVAWAGTRAITGAVIVAGAVAVAWAVTFVGVLAGAWGVASTGVWAWALVIISSFLSGLGLHFWQRAEKKQDWLKYLAILAFPWFCSFPIVFIFSTLAMYDFLSWQWPQILIAWIIIFGACTALWKRGQKLDHDARNPQLDHDARNPLYGILDKR